MRLLKDYSVEVKGEFTVVREGDIVKVVKPGTVGYYSERFDPVKSFERALAEYEGTLVEDAKYLDGTGLVEYRIGVKSLGDAYVLVDDYPGSLEYAENMLSYYRHIVRAPRWVVFSAITSRFSYCDGSRIYSVTPDGGVLEYGTCVPPVEFLVSTHFSADVVSLPPNVAGMEEGECFGANLHPLERARICPFGDYYSVTVWRGDEKRYCFYDGRWNYLCARSYAGGSDVFEKYLELYDLFLVGRGRKVVLRRVNDYYVSVGSSEFDYEYYRRLVDDVLWMLSLDDFMFAVFYGGEVYFVFGFGVVSYDGELFLYSRAAVDDVYDAMKVVLDGRFVPAGDAEEAYLSLFGGL